MATATWEPPKTEMHGTLRNADRKRLEREEPNIFAFPKQKKAPLTDSNHVRTALAMFCRVQGASDEDRDLALENIKKAGQHFNQPVNYTSWRDLCPLK
jgi:hypothetical protein